jgi:protease IV
MIFAIILLALLALSMLLNFRHAVSGITRGRVRPYHTYGPRLEEVTVKESSSANKIAIVPIEGVITGQAIDQGGFSMVAVVKEELQRARQDRDVKAVILKVDSPGGEVLASDEIANAIEDFQTNSAKPVIVSMGSLAASGGYYVSARCGWIVANELTITGSIGVIMHGLNYRGLLDKIGVRPEVFKSGKYKDMLSGTKEPDEITPEERQMVQSLINETFDKFKSVVEEGRQSAYTRQHGKRLSADWKDYADGRILSGKEALRLGFVDELGDFDVAVDRAEKIAGIPKAELIEYQPVFDLANLFHMFGKSETKAVKLDLGADIPRLQPGCMYFLSPTYLH